MPIRNDLSPEAKRLRDTGKFAILKYFKICKRYRYKQTSKYLFYSVFKLKYILDMADLFSSSNFDNMIIRPFFQRNSVCTR